jgi:hypothetical protein
MPRAKSTVADTLISATDLASLLGLSLARVGQLTTAGALTRVNGRYRLGESVSKYISHLREDARRTTRSAAEQRVHEARARSLEMKNAERERRTIDLEESVSAVDAICGAMLIELGAFSAEFGDRDPAMRRHADEKVYALRERIAARIGAITVAHRAGTDLDEAARQRQSAGGGPAA